MERGDCTKLVKFKKEDEITGLKRKIIVFYAVDLTLLMS